MKILFVDPAESSLFSFRKELLDRLICEHQVVLCTELTKKTKKEYYDKVKVIDVPNQLKNKNIFLNIKLKNTYKEIIKKERPDFIISYKIKPNIYCGLYAKNIPMIANITGLGNMFKKDNLLSKLGIMLYKMSFKNIKYVFFQNMDGYIFFKKHKIPINNYNIIPGSGVNIKKYEYKKIDNTNNNDVKFLFASRAIKEKGFFLLIKAIPCILRRFPNAVFTFLNAEEDIYSIDDFRKLISLFPKNVIAHQKTDDMKSIYYSHDFVVLPSFYREGISNVLLESLSCGRPIITTNDNPGCMEVLQEGINGYGVTSKHLGSLIEALSKACTTSKERISEMGKSGRKYVSERFNRDLVIEQYFKVLKK